MSQRLEFETVGLPWVEVPCRGCKTLLGSVAGQQSQLCPDCRERMLETMARQIDPSYDPAVMHSWEECGRILRRLYCFNLTPRTAEHPHGATDVGGWQTMGLERP